MQGASGGGKMSDITALEERIAHLIRAVDDMSDVVARQGSEIDRLTRLTEMLAQREAERIDAGQDAPAANVPPPHW
jgi:SlyX protein